MKNLIQLIFYACLVLSSCVPESLESSNADSGAFQGLTSQDSSFFKVDIVKWRKESLDKDSLQFFIGAEQVGFMNVVDFSSNPTLRMVHPLVELDSSTTISELSRVFPESSKLNRRSGYLWRGTVSIYAQKEIADLDFWILEFWREKLIKIYLYEMYSKD
ncbi:MAG: hypothetical protein AAF741_03165 [Bacteroidota bacterium]